MTAGYSDQCTRTSALRLFVSGALVGVSKSIGKYVSEAVGARYIYIYIYVVCQGFQKEFQHTITHANTLSRSLTQSVTQTRICRWNSRWLTLRMAGASPAVTPKRYMHVTAVCFHLYVMERQSLASLHSYIHFFCMIFHGFVFCLAQVVQRVLVKGATLTKAR